MHCMTNVKCLEDTYYVGALPSLPVVVAMATMVSPCVVVGCG
jgi:hypothetical protein